MLMLLMEESLHLLRLVAYPIIFTRFTYLRWLFGISSINRVYGKFEGFPPKITPVLGCGPPIPTYSGKWEIPINKPYITWVFTGYNPNCPLAKGTSLDVLLEVRINA